MLSTAYSNGLRTACATVDGDPSFRLPRRCFREPSNAVLNAAARLSDAADAHLRGDDTRARALIHEADDPAISDWLEPLWGGAGDNPDQQFWLRTRVVPDEPSVVPLSLRSLPRRPRAATVRAVLDHWGHICAFCGTPLVSKAAQDVLRAAHPDALRWGATNDGKHLAFACMALVVDHVVPHSRGGTSEFGNLVPTCSGCNYGRNSFTLAEQGLLDPRNREPARTEWDGLGRLLRKK